jgi:hypothetical protein
MSPTTFRAVVGGVMVGFLVLAVVAFVRLVPAPPEPSPSASLAASGTPGPTRSAAPTRSPGPAFASPQVVEVGAIPRGTASTGTLLLRFVERGVDAIPRGEGTFRVTLTDHAGDGSTVAFAGTPTVEAPGSLGATATLASPNVLVIGIVDSDIVNIESITITGLGIRVASTAANRLPSLSPARWSCRSGP